MAGATATILAAETTSAGQSSATNDPSGSLSSRVGPTSVSVLSTDGVLGAEQIPGPRLHRCRRYFGWKDAAASTTLAG
jgi:hypothetical protein